MKANWLWISLAVFILPGCEKQEEAPKAVVVAEEEASEEDPVLPPLEPLAPEGPETPPLIEPPVSETQEEPTVGERVDRAIEATERSLQEAEDKTRDGVAIAAEKTEEGVRRGAEATGRFLQDLGDRIEEAAGGGDEEESVDPADP